MINCRILLNINVKVILLIVITAIAFLFYSDGKISYSANKSEQLDCQTKLEGEKDSCKTYIDLSKLIISLSTGVFVLVPAFFKIIGKRVPKSNKALLYGLILLGLSIIAGLFVISALAGTQRIGAYNIAAPHIKYSSMVQWLSFLLGLSLCGHFILQNLFETKARKTKPKSKKKKRAG